ncbi:protein ALP1-like [Photinus pyralis]|nr:protein ALP1-like [Photinus pyralis]
MVEHLIKKQDTLMRAAVEPRIKLQITLRYLATGDSFSTLEHMYRIPKSTISKFLPEVLKAIYEGLKDFIKMPTSTNDWAAIAKGFEERWQFPKCCGALDGKHINIQCPNNSHSDFYNYKGYFSTILFALVDHNYCFTYIDIGSNGRVNDSTVFRNSSLKAAIENGSVGFPKWGVIVGDDAFPLKDYLMKPYSRHGRLSNSEKVFNYRLSRARRIVENAFGVLAMRFRIFRAHILLNPEKVDDIVKATCAIHNWLRQTSPNSYMPPSSVDREDENGQIILGSWRNENACLGLQDIVCGIGSNNFTTLAANCRRKFTDYFMGEGAVGWQWNMIH